MKENLVSLLKEENKKFENNLIREDVDLYVDKILKNAYIISYYDAERLMAFAAYYANSQDKRAFLSIICVHEAYRREGLGRFLIDQVISHVTRKGYSILSLEVLKDNLPAVNLYQSLKFEVTESNEDKLVMCKYI